MPALLCWTFWAKWNSAFLQQSKKTYLVITVDISFYLNFYLKREKNIFTCGQNAGLSSFTFFELFGSISVGKLFFTRRFRIKLFLDLKTVFEGGKYWKKDEMLTRSDTSVFCWNFKLASFALRLDFERELSVERLENLVQWKITWWAMRNAATVRSFENSFP
jgi:hypothetical protein